MTELHVIVGLVTLIVAVALWLWNTLRISRRLQQPSFRKVLVGLLDLQILLGIIAFALHPVWGVWLLHPLLMLVAAALAHTLLKETRPPRTQLWGYLAVPVMLIAGIYLPQL